MRVTFLRLSLLLILLSVFAQLVMPNTVQAAPVRGTAGDLWGDIVLGQPNFSEIAPFATTNSSLFLPHGVLVDTTNGSDNKLYVYDSGNNRILGYDLEDCLAEVGNPLNCTADIVIGQPNFTSATCNGDSAFQNYPDRAAATASTLCTQEESTLSLSESGSGSSMAVDGSGNLYVTDFYNHRVLRYNSPFTTDQVADQVWGQADFTGVLCNRGGSADNNTLCFEWGDTNNWTAGVDIDSSGNLWVSDSGNNRVLRFPFSSGSISSTADLVLGQADFTSIDPSSDLDRLWDPSVVRVLDDGTVYVADTNNDRIIRYTTPTTGEAGTTFGSGFDAPQGIDFDPTNPGKLWIMNRGRSRLELWDTSDGSLDQIKGETDNGNLLGDATGSVGVDSAGNIYLAIGTGDEDNTVLIFESAGGETEVWKRLYAASQFGNTITSSQLNSINAVTVTNDQVVVADEGRILFWNIPNGLSDLTTGKAADGYVYSSSINSQTLGCCYAMTTDNNYLYTSTRLNGDDPKSILIYELPLTSGEAPFATITYPIPLLGGGTMSSSSDFEKMFGLAVAPDSSYLWVTDKTSNRAFRIRNPLSSSRVVDVILGQTNSTGMSCNQGGSATATTLCEPGAIGLDLNGNLYISDHSLEFAGNHRLLRYAAGTFPTDNTEIIYATTPTHITTSISNWLPIFNQFNAMIIGFNSYSSASSSLAPNGVRFPSYFNSPMSSTLTANGYLNDYFPMAVSGDFDNDNNLYMGELNRSRLVIYESPFGNTAPVLTEVTPVTTPTTDTTPSYTFSSTKAGTVAVGGACSTSTTQSLVGNNTITFATLAPGTYSNCTIQVTDTSDQTSNLLAVTPFTITVASSGGGGESSSSGSSSSGSNGSSGDRTCSAQLPTGIPDIFEVRRTPTTATLFVNPDYIGSVTGYHIIYGFKNQEQRFGQIKAAPENLSNGVVSLQVKDLDPKAQYWFTVAVVNDCAVGNWSNWMRVNRSVSRLQTYYRYLLGQK